MNTAEGIRNTAVGENTLDSTTLGHDNIALGHSAGQLLSSGSDNVYIGNQGQATESNTIRIGNSTDHSAAYLAGVRGVSVSSGEYVVVDANGQLGSTAAAGGGYWTAGGNDICNSNGGNVGIGMTNPGSPLSVNGIVESTSAGFKFPGGSTQTAASPPTRAWQDASVTEITTTCTTWMGTDLSITATTAAGPVLLLFSGSCWSDGPSNAVRFVFSIDGTEVTPSGADNVHKNLEGTFPVSAQWLAQVSAGEHTFTVRWKVSGGTGYLCGGGT